MPPLDERGLWGKQAQAIRNLEESLAADRPRALVQMATGSGKTFTAATLCYRLIRYAGAKRILFLVDRSNLGRQAKLEFDKFTIAETQRKFPADYNIQHLTANTVDMTSRVVISTIQRTFSILRGDAELDPDLDERSGFELAGASPVEVAYNPALPPDAFDVIIIDECHRSIYGQWRQMLEYFDAHLIGLTATPTRQAFGFFRQNLVMEYSHDMGVADHVNVDFTVYKIEDMRAVDRSRRTHSGPGACSRAERGMARPPRRAKRAGTRRQSASPRRSTWLPHRCSPHPTPGRERRGMAASGRDARLA